MIALTVRSGQTPSPASLVADIQNIGYYINVQEPSLIMHGERVPTPGNKATLSDLLASLYRAHMVVVYYPTRGAYTDDHLFELLIARVLADPLLAHKTICQLNWQPDCKHQLEMTATLRMAGITVTSNDAATLTEVKERVEAAYAGT